MSPRLRRQSVLKREFALVCALNQRWPIEKERKVARKRQFSNCLVFIRLYAKRDANAPQKPSSEQNAFFYGKLRIKRFNVARQSTRRTTRAARRLLDGGGGDGDCNCRTTTKKNACNVWLAGSARAILASAAAFAVETTILHLVIIIAVLRCARARVRKRLVQTTTTTTSKRARA